MGTISFPPELTLAATGSSYQADTPKAKPTRIKRNRLGNEAIGHLEQHSKEVECFIDAMVNRGLTLFLSRDAHRQRG